MVSFFKGKSSTVIIQIIALSIIVHLHFFVQPPVVIVPAQSSILYYFLAPLQGFPSIVVSLFYHVIIILQALLLNFLVSNYRLFPNFNYTAAMSYILLTSLLPAWTNISDALVTNFLLLLMLQVLMRLTSAQRPISVIFNYGIVTGITILLFPSVAVLFLIGLISILIIRSFRLNEVFVYIAGGIMPVYFLASILFLKDKLDWLKNLIPQLSFHLMAPSDKLSVFVAFTIIAVCVLAGFVAMQNNFGKLVISARKLWIIITLSFLLCAGTGLFMSGKLWLQSLLLVIPFGAAVAANLFYYSRGKIFVALLFWLLVIISLFNSFGGAALLKK